MLFVKTKIKKSKIHGIGLFADQFIKKGQVIWKFNPIIDKKITKKEMNSLPDLAKAYILKYAFLDHKQEWVLCGDDARFFNHSITPTCKDDGVTNIKDDVTTALRNIKRGEELTSDYYKFDFSTKDKFSIK